jgi:hypothetical protein
MSEPTRIVVVIVALSLGGILLAAGGSHLRQWYRISASEVQTVRDAAQERGVAEFEGTVRPIEGETFHAPFTGTEAVASSYTVRAPSTGEGKYRTVTSGTVARPFLVADETGCVEVDPSGGDIEPANSERRLTVGENDTLPDDVRLRLSNTSDELDLDTILAAETDERRYYWEGTVTAGDEVHVYGATTADRTPSSRSATAVLTKADAADLFRITVGDEGDASRSKLVEGLVLLGLGLMLFAPGVGWALTFI